MIAKSIWLKRDVEAAFRAGHDRMEMRGAAGTELEVEIELARSVTEANEGGFRRDRLEKLQAASLRRVDGRMHGASSPLDEEWEQTAGIVFECERFPVEDSAVGTFARAGLRPDHLNAFAFEALCERFDVAWVRRPAYDHGFFELAKIAFVFRVGLLRIGRDDFEIAIFAEREQRVLRAGAGMDSTECCAHAGALFDERDAFFQVGATDQNVIEQFGSGLLLRR